MNRVGLLDRLPQRNQPSNTLERPKYCLGTLRDTDNPRTHTVTQEVIPLANREPPKMKLVKVVGELTPAHKQIYVDWAVRLIERLRREERQVLMQQSSQNKEQPVVSASP